MNQYPLNSIPLNTSTIAYTLLPIPLGVLIFNDQELCNFDEGIAALTDNRLDLPNFNLVSYKSPLIDNGGVVSHFVNDRDLEFEVYIKGSDRIDYEQKVQDFKKKISKQEGVLQLLIGGQSLFCNASVTSFKRTERDSEKAGTFSLQFKSLTNYTDGFQTQLSYLNILGNFQGGVTNLGHRETNLSIILSFTSAVGLNEVVVLVNGYPITISENISTGDVLNIDAINGRVELNAVEVNYTGLLPFLGTNESLNGFNPVEFQFNVGSTVDVNIILFYHKQFL